MRESGGDRHLDRLGHQTKYCEAPEIRETAEFLRGMNPRLRRKRRIRIDPALIVYTIVIAFMIYLLILEFGAPKKTTVEIKRTVTEVPVIDEGVKVTPGEESENGEVSMEIWYNQSLETSCNGVERFDTGLGFMQDWTDMLNKYDSVYGESDEEEINMQPPSAMFGNVSGYDCEDIAHATMCLAERYDINCSFWMRQNVGPVVPKDTGHLGICCDVEGQWKCI